MPNMEQFLEWARETHVSVTTHGPAQLHWTTSTRPHITHEPTGMVISVQCGPYSYSSGRLFSAHDIVYNEATQWEIMIIDFGEASPEVVHEAVGQEPFEWDGQGGPFSYVTSARIVRLFADLTSIAALRAYKLRHNQAVKYPRGKRRVEIC